MRQGNDAREVSIQYLSPPVQEPAGFMEFGHSLRTAPPTIDLSLRGLVPSPKRTPSHPAERCPIQEESAESAVGPIRGLALQHLVEHRDRGSSLQNAGYQILKFSFGRIGD